MHLRVFPSLSLLALSACGAPPVLPADAAPAVDVPSAPEDAGTSLDDVAPVGDVPFAEEDSAARSDASGLAPDGPSSLCPLPPACDAPAPAPDPRVPWSNGLSSTVVLQGSPRHRGRDLYVREGGPQWALAKFAYGPADSDLHGEDVDVFVLRDCRSWERLGRARTTRDGEHPTTLGVEDSGGRVFLEIPPARALGRGWHRLRFVVRGDHSIAEQFIRVLPADARLVVTDVDGTLTESETAEFATLLTGVSPAANPGSPEVLRALALRGFEVFYLTARPEWLATRTREWLVERGFPQGIVHTTLGLTGATGAPAETFKRNELARLRSETGVVPTHAFGNTDTDAAAFATAGVPSDRSWLYRFTPAPGRGTRHEDYRTILPGFTAIEPVCR